ncbi:LytTr DNA-binding domain protein [Ostertagia ostertagi]
MVAITSSLHLPVDSIRYVHFDGNASIVYTDCGNHVTMQTLNAIHEILGNEQFYRLRRNMIVGRRAITEIRRQGRDILVSLEPPFDEELRISKTPKAKFLQWSSKGASRS